MEKLSDERVNELLENEVKFKKMKVVAERARLKRAAKIKLLLKKAEDAGLSVSDEEVSKELKRVKK